MPIKHKHSSLLKTFVNNGRQKIYNIDPCLNVIKLFLFFTDVGGK